MFTPAKSDREQSNDDRSRIQMEEDLHKWLGEQGQGLPATEVRTACRRNLTGLGGNESNAEIRGTDGPGLAHRASDVTKEASAAQRNAHLYSLIRDTKIKTSVIYEAVKTKGLVKVLDAIAFWLREKDRLNKSRSSGSAVVSPAEVASISTRLSSEVASISARLSSELPSTSTCSDEHTPLSFPSLDCRTGTDDDTFAKFENLTDLILPPRTDVLNASVNVEGSVGHLWTGNYGLVPKSEAVSGLSGELPSSPTLGYTAGHGKTPRSMLNQKRSPSPSRSGVLCGGDLRAFEDGRSERSKMRRNSPIPADYRTSSQTSNEFSAYLSPPAPDVVGSPPASSALDVVGTFGPVGANSFLESNSPFTWPPTDLHPMDFNYFHAQVPALIDENMGLGSSVHGFGLVDRPGSLGGLANPLSPEIASVDRKQPCLGVVPSWRASPSSSSRDARKKRFYRNRKSASYQGGRAFETSSRFGGKAGGMCPTGSMRGSCRSQGSAACSGSTCRTVDRGDQENLQLVLQKVLRPSDVGSLGRIVLPKKDAETYLPWLGAREGIQLVCEDYDTGEVMTLRYRFWPNNKSRMYLLESTGDFVTKHQLQESDRMLIYKKQPQGTFIIRARKAQDCVDSKPQDRMDGLGNLDQNEDTKRDWKDSPEQSAAGGPCSNGPSPLVGTKSNSGFDHDGVSESNAHGSSIITLRDDLMSFADLPDAPMGEGAEHLVRFPSLEALDVLWGCPAPANEEDVKSFKDG